MKNLKSFLSKSCGIIALTLSFCACNYNGMQYAQPSNYIAVDNAAIAGEQYNKIIENPFIDTDKEAISTFSIDADGGSYGNLRRFLNNNTLPPSEAIRTEELINYFQYDYANPTDNKPLDVNGEVSSCPWNTKNRLIRIGFKGKSVAKKDLPPSNLVLLIDVSGSMSDYNKLPLLKQCLMGLVDELRPQDKVAIVTYAGSFGTALTATSGNEKNKIKTAINGLGAGGSTNGSGGIIAAYDIAQANFVRGGNNRVILMTDGDFNVGITSQAELIKLIEEKRQTGIFLTTIGVGIGNYNDGMMEQLANKGNGIYEYIDNTEQGKKVFVYEFNKFYTIAKDVKVQVEFNPKIVKSYRLIGYENRVLAKEDFTNDKKDAGDLSLGQTVTALYEIIPQTVAYEVLPTFTIDFRYKEIDKDVSETMRLEVFDDRKQFEKASENMRFAASVAAFGMVLRNSQYKGDATYDKVNQWASSAISYNPHSFRTEFISLINKAKSLK
jgi:Ca-activated chloride channel family protein